MATTAEAAAAAVPPAVPAPEPQAPPPPQFTEEDRGYMALAMEEVGRAGCWGADMRTPRPMESI